jgi:flagellar basal-body rod modification protein FlgD
MDPVTGPGSTVAAGSLAQAMGGNKSLDRDAFLKLLVAQLKNQDPLKPQDNAQFVAELAQFSSLEQSMGINDRLDLLAAQNAGLANAQAVGLVGSVATVRGSMVTVDGTGVGTGIGFSLSAKSNSTIVTVRNQSGQVVRTLDVGERNAGFVSLTWDGRDDAGNIQPAGTYVIGVEAQDAVGTPISVSQETSGKVKQVSFDKGYPVLTLDNGLSVPVSDLLKVAVSTTPTP